MNRREILIGSVCVAISVTARGSGRGAFSSPTHQSIGDGCVISTHSGLSVLDKGTAVFVFGCCESAISEITRLGLSLRTVAYFGGSTHGPNAEALLAGLWTVPREGIRKIDNTSEFVDWVVENHDRVALIGNFSAPFASRMLVLIAAKARKLNSKVFAIGAVPSPGVQGAIRVRRGWVCIEALRRIGCCVVTVPEVEFDIDGANATTSSATSMALPVNEGSLYCRALEGALNQVQ